MEDLPQQSMLLFDTWHNISISVLRIRWARHYQTRWALLKPIWNLAPAESVSVTVDIWSDRTRWGYPGITVHFIGDDKTRYNSSHASVLKRVTQRPLLSTDLTIYAKGTIWLQSWTASSLTTQLIWRKLSKQTSHWMKTWTQSHWMMTLQYWGR